MFDFYTWLAKMVKKLQLIELSNITKGSILLKKTQITYNLQKKKFQDNYHYNLYGAIIDHSTLLTLTH